MLSRLLISALLTLMLSVNVKASDIDSQLGELDSLLQSDLPKAVSVIKSLEPRTGNFTSQQLAKFKTLKSINHLYTGNFIAAKRVLDEAEGLNPNQELLTQIYLYKVTVSIGLGEYQQAFQQLEQNLRRIEQGDDTHVKVQSYLRLLNVYLDLEAYKEMLLVVNRVLAFNKGRDTKSECYGMLYLAVANLELDKHEAAAEYFRRSGDYCQKHGYPLIVAMSVKGQARALFEQQKYPNALPGFLSSLEAYEKFNFNIEIYSNWAFLAETYYHLGMFAEARDYAQRVADLAQVQMNIRPKQRAHGILALLARDAEQYQQAYEHQVRSQMLSETLLNEQRLKQNAYQMAQFEIAEKTRELDKIVQDYDIFGEQRKVLNQQRSYSYMFSTIFAGASICLFLMLVAVWSQRSNYKRQAQRDQLTGVYSRFIGQNMAENQLIQCQTRHSDYSVILFDLDSLKQINEQYGNANGDWALQQVVNVLNELIDKKHILLRMSSEEFGLFMPQTHIEQAYELTTQFLEQVASIETKLTGHQFAITVSAGLSCWTEQDLSLDPIISRAALGLKQAKEQGKNQAVVYNPVKVKQSQADADMAVAES
ncbi:GGDEF domain-containing protein [Shewanella maritima]|uniref:diguanylate cyclase n=1 Tax=Shewanella maritima TaxID=2520507 RepID=A0A411PEI3_9GAMM|nr:GGDEF domain-containing protein [Shewanella maritima]QBF81951.1 GGDEF domain-containing protein [Shewanella maritima]